MDSDLFSHFTSGASVALNTLLLPWNWRVDVALVLFVAAVVYLRGWRRLRDEYHQADQGFATGLRLASFLSSLALLGLALLSPIDMLSSQLFSMHVMQYSLLVVLAPALMLLGDPRPALFWGLPYGARRTTARWLQKRTSALRRGLRAITSPLLVWPMFIVALLGWHDGDVFDAVLHNALVHDLALLTSFAIALLYWGRVTCVGARSQEQHGRIVALLYLLATMPIIGVISLIALTARQPLYAHYTTAAQLWGLTAMQDQALGGALMWFPGIAIFLVAALILMAQGLRLEESM